jgi:single-strand DNA-binding protein
MASFNRVILLGNLTRDVEVRYLQSGMAVADIGMAVNDRRKNQSGEWIDEVTFVDVTLWGRTAEVAGEYLSKGSPILIEGRLKLDQWEKDGQKHSKLKVIGERMQMVGSKGGGGGGGGGSSRGGRGQNENFDDGGGDYGDAPSGPPARVGSQQRSAPAAPPPPTQDEIPF